MENLTFDKALEMAESLDTQEINYYFGEKKSGTTIFAGENNIVSIFQRLTKFRNTDNYYIRSSKYDEFGNILPKGVYDERLYYHKKYARNDKQVIGVSYDIIGIKRKTTHLPAGVIISNINFYTE